MLSNPTQPQQSPYQIPLVSPIDFGESAQGQIGVLGLNPVIAVAGIFPSQGSGGASVNYLGSAMWFAGNFTPSGWAASAGALTSISQNTALFSILGTLYGGNGTTTFELPDLRSRVTSGAQ